MNNHIHFNKVSENIWEVPAVGGMRVPVRIYANNRLMSDIKKDDSIIQAMNVAHLPGIQKYSLVMPDIHYGYGFPIGGVAAMDAKDGVISPGGIGFDINCGVRLLRSELQKNDIEPVKRKLVTALFNHIPTGVGAKSKLRLKTEELKKVLKTGVRWAVAQGFGDTDDLQCIEENGCIDGADPSVVSQRAIERGRPQLGTLGSGNHFLEIDYVARIYDDRLAEKLRLRLNQVVVLIHTGSRGFGYQVCDDYLSLMVKAVSKYGIHLPDRQLCCAPIQSAEGQDYLGAMRCAINYAFVNRQMITHWTREIFEQVMDLSPNDLGMDIVYDVCHNIAKFEEYEINGEKRSLCVHRKGATRAFPPNHEKIPKIYQSIGQPVLIPGDMGRYSFVLVGTEKAMKETFGSSCHGAGRQKSRRKAKKMAAGRNIFQEMEDHGIFAMAKSNRTMSEEIPEAYKDVSDVVDTMHDTGITEKVVKLVPLGVIKG